MITLHEHQKLAIRRFEQNKRRRVIMVDFEVENFIDDNINKRSQSFSRIMYNKNYEFKRNF